MNERKIQEYRAAEAACVKWAESDEIKSATRLRWRKLAEEWAQLAEEAERKSGLKVPILSLIDDSEAAA